MSGRFKSIWSGVKETFSEFSADDVMTQAAAIAFYSGLSLAPVLTVTVWIAQNVFGDEAKQKIAKAFEQVIGERAAAPINTILAPAAEQANTSMSLAGIVSLGLVLFTATGVFAQLQAALNAIWSVQAKPSGNGIWLYMRKRFLSLGMLLSILFLLLISMVASTAIQGFVEVTGASSGWIAEGANTVMSLLLFFGLFAALFKYIPDARLGWPSVWVGAGTAAVLFMIGKFGLGMYLGRGSYESSYGVVVGSFVALLVWVYYSAIILLIGAEVTQVTARRTGDGIQPEDHAVKVETRLDTVATGQSADH
jgi:membrane protein